jgi:hypothetical protein
LHSSYRYVRRPTHERQDDEVADRYIVHKARDVASLGRDKAWLRLPVCLPYQGLESLM